MGNIELRGLKSSDLFGMFRILSKLGLKDLRSSLSQESIQAMVSTTDEADEDEADEDRAQTVGFAVFLEIAEIVLANLPKCENEIFAFLSGLSGLTAAEVADLPLADFTEMVITVITREDFRDFFTAASGLFRKMTD